MLRRISLGILAAVVLFVCGCDAGLVHPNVEVEEPVPTPTNAASTLLPSPTPEPTLDPRVTLQGEQLSSFASCVGAPLVLTAWSEIGFGSGTDQIYISEQDSLFWDTYFANLLADTDDPDDLFGPGNVSTNLGYLASEVWPDSYSRGTDDFIVRGDLISIKAVDLYLKNAFGASAPEDTGGLVPEGTDSYLYVQTAATFSVRPVDLPDSVTTTPDGILTLLYAVHIDGEATDEEYRFEARLLPAPDSPFGCNVSSYSIYFAGEREAESEEDFDEPLPSVPIPVSTPVPQVPGSGPSAANGFDANGFVFADSSSRLLTAADLANLSSEMLGFARNEIFARHGNEFQREKYRNHYSQYAWYQALDHRPDIGMEELNAVERANVELIQQFEAAVG